MSAENKGLVRRLFQEVWNRGNLAVADEILAPTYVSHGDAPDVFSVGVPAFKQRVSGVLSRFAGLEMTLQDLIAEDEKVVARWCSRATVERVRQDGAPKGRILRMSEIGIFRVDAGKIAESWGSPFRPIDDLLVETGKVLARALKPRPKEESISFPPS